ncbi:MAG: hypothetical protein MK193_12390 [Lentisphaeria bacterium]|nr:hypothetical protein [Lentisphaeria bacterium]
MKILKSVLAANFALIMSVQAQSYDPELLRSYEFDIEFQTMKEVRAVVSPMRLKEKLKYKGDIRPPRLKKEHVQALVAQEINKRLEGKMPTQRFTDIELEAKEKYRLYKIGDKIKISVANSRTGGKIETVEGILHEKSDREIMIHHSKYIYEDIIAGDLPHFIQKQHNQAVETYIRKETEKYQNERTKYEEQLNRELAPKIWKAEGYMWLPKKKDWVPLQSVFDKLYIQQWVRQYKKNRPQVTTSVYETNDLCWVEERKRWELCNAEATFQAEKGKVREDATLQVWVDKVSTLFSSFSDEILTQGSDQKVVPDGEAPTEDGEQPAE